MTDGGSPVADTVNEAVRRLGHETSNAANAAAVNVEVLRTRLERGGDPPALLEFAQRAADALDRLAGGLGALRAVALATAGAARRDGALHAQPAISEPGAIELIGGELPALDDAAQRFAASAGVMLRAGERGIILHVSGQKPAQSATE